MYSIKKPLICWLLNNNMIFDHYVFYVKVPPEWNLSLDKVYIYCEIPKPDFEHMRRSLGAFEYDMCIHMHEGLQTIVNQAPEFKLKVHNLSEFVAQQTALNEEDAKIFKEHCLVDIREWSDTEWRQDSFFSAYNNPSKDKKIEWLKTLCKARRIPISARGALYNWALLSVVDLLDENNNIKDGKALKIQDGTTFEFKSGPTYVRGSFSDRTILLHP